MVWETQPVCVELTLIFSLSTTDYNVLLALQARNATWMANPAAVARNAQLLQRGAFVQREGRCIIASNDSFRRSKFNAPLPPPVPV